MKIRILVFVIFVALTVASCYSPEVRPVYDIESSCDAILLPALLRVPFDELAIGQEETEEWILTQFPTTTIQIEPIGSYTDDSESYVWNVGAKGFSLWRNSNVHVIEVFDLSDKRPTLGHILRCFGDPGFYRLEVVPAEYYIIVLELWYPELGVVFRTSMRSNQTNKIDMDTEFISPTLIVPSGTAEDMLLATRPYTEESLKDELALMREWPEDFTEFVLEDYAEDGENTGSTSTESPLAVPAVRP